ncbi:hypothetical protein EBR96_06540, partial [bacterium]|nr:hypothetical protein [bacterium]
MSKKRDVFSSHWVGHLDRIEEASSGAGYWCLPEGLSEVSDVFSAAVLSELPDIPTREQAKNLFKLYPWILDRFCRLKMSECEYLARMQQAVAPRSKVILSGIYQADAGYVLVEAEVVFVNDRAATLRERVVKRAPIIDGVWNLLTGSSWLTTQANETKIDKVVGVKEGLDQRRHVQKILRNQLRGIGTLLYLPTGYGKTFVMLTAILQHVRLQPFEKRRPYLVVVPYVNLLDSWGANFEILRDMFPDLVRTSQITLVRKSVDFGKAVSESASKNQIIVVNRETLTSYVDTLIPKQSVAETLGVYNVVCKLASILIRDGRVLVGDPPSWRGNLDAVLRTRVSLKDRVVHLFGDLGPDYFYPTLRGRKLNVDALNLNRAHFVSTYTDRVAELREFCWPNPERVDTTFLGQVFDFLHLWHHPDLTEVSAQKILDLLNPVYDQSSRARNLYQSLKAKFNGILVDESQFVLVHKPKKGSNGVTEIVYDIAKTLQERCRRGSNENPLIIAASATPWPNDIEELGKQLKFLFPKMLGEYGVLHDHLFGIWNQFESDCESGQPSPEKFGMIQAYLFKWIRTLFDASVSYQAPTDQSNRSIEYVMWINCHDQCRVPGGAEILGLMKSFYSKVLQPTSGKETNFLECALARITPETALRKRAYFVEQHADAAFLAQKLVDHFKSLGFPDIQVGFFYDEGFVKDQKAHVNPEYTTITFNTDREINKNAFNNEFRFENYLKYLDQ